MLFQIQYWQNLLILQGLRNVEHISVQDNPIKRLPGFAFAGLRNITELHLGYNKLEKIDGYVQSRLTKLT